MMRTVAWPGSWNRARHAASSRATTAQPASPLPPATEVIAAFVKASGGREAILSRRRAGRREFSMAARA